MTRAAAMEHAPHAVRIDAIAPGRVVTDMMLSSGIADMRTVAAGLPLRRMSHPADVAAAVVWLSSSEASHVFGQVLPADGGFLTGISAPKSTPSDRTLGGTGEGLEGCRPFGRAFGERPSPWFRQRSKHVIERRRLQTDHSAVPRKRFGMASRYGKNLK